MNLHVDIQAASGEPAPEEGEIRRWIAATLAGQGNRDEVEITVRLVDIEEMSVLNETYRGKKGPTNVLSFPADPPDEVDLPLLGDIIICAPVIRAEATAQGKLPEAHWAHMTVHGTLHLLGYDHIEEDEATTMEALESAILTGLNYRCPYADEPRESVS